MAGNTPAADKPADAKITRFAKLKVQVARKAKMARAKLPPSSWNANLRSDKSGASGTSVSTSGDTAESTDKASTAAEGPKATAQATSDPIVDPSQDKPETGDGDDANAEEPISPATLAARIQSLLSSFPPFYALAPSGSIRLSKVINSGNDDPPVADTKLFSLLSSASAMNGSVSKGRESVWSVLERLRYPSPSKPGQVKDSGSTVEPSSVMICCPLEPTEDTEVEIARSEVVSLVDEGKDGETLQEKKFSWWPFGKQPDAPPSSDPTKPTEVVVWIPSRTKVSLQAAWWGYRIYLPPPVMAILSDKSVEAAKRAAMITTALSWLVSHIPTEMLPPTLQAIVGVVKGIVPIMGYVGGFIAWSWSTIQSFDKGQGVILSATWLLPIALVPGTWNYVEPPPPSNTPATPTAPPQTSPPEDQKPPSTDPTPPPENQTPPDPPPKDHTPSPVPPVASPTS